MTSATLRTYTAKHLGQMARERGVAGWHSMRKDELIAALAKAKSKPKPVTKKEEPAPKPAPRKRPTAAQRRIAKMQEQKQRLQDLSVNSPDASRDQLLLLVRDPYWLQVTWEITPGSVARARTTLGQSWHGATPVVRLARLGDDGSVIGTRQVKVHGGVGHWYLDVVDPPARYRAEIGYVDYTGQFCSLARSNEVATPEPGVSKPSENTWKDVARNADRVFALSGGYSEEGPSQELRQALEDRLRRPLGRPNEMRYLNLPSVPTQSSLDVQIDAELVVRGETSPHTHLTVLGEPVDVDEEGAFVVKLPLPDRRQVIPVVASSADGLHQKTLILGVERNTKALEPRRRDATAG